MVYFNPQLFAANRIVTPKLLEVRRKILKMNSKQDLPVHPVQNYDYFLVLDFEATCDTPQQTNPQEIIEFPVLKICGSTMQEVSRFHSYIRPTHHPELSSFCTQLTGITQEMVNNSPTFPEVFTQFQRWMSEDVGLDNRLLFVTCGDWDLKTMLPSQCELLGLEVPQYCKTWLNIKKAYHMYSGRYLKGLRPMITDLNLPFVGTLHSGINDCENISNIVAKLAKRGVQFKETMNIH